MRGILDYNVTMSIYLSHFRRRVAVMYACVDQIKHVIILLCYA